MFEFPLPLPLPDPLPLPLPDPDPDPEPDPDPDPDDEAHVLAYEIGILLAVEVSVEVAAVQMAWARLVALVPLRARLLDAQQADDPQVVVSLAPLQLTTVFAEMLVETTDRVTLAVAFKATTIAGLESSTGRQKYPRVLVTEVALPLALFVTFKIEHAVLVEFALTAQKASVLLVAQLAAVQAWA